MSPHRIIVQVIAIALLAALPGCQRNTSPAGPSAGSLFFSSFEETKDISQWYGVSLESLRHDTPPDGGELSAFVSGAFVLPHAYSEFGPFETDVNVGLRCWGKSLADTGVVLLHPTDNDSTKLELKITEKKWTLYESDKNLVVRQGQKLRVEMNSAISDSGAMLIDLVDVYRIE